MQIISSCTTFITLLQQLYLKCQKARRRQQVYPGLINTKKVDKDIRHISLISTSVHISCFLFLPAHLRSFYELNEATMLHTKSKVANNTMNWKTQCKIPKQSEEGCKLGFAFPIGADPKKEKYDKDGWAYNCYINEKIETYWWPRLVEAIKARG